MKGRDASGVEWMHSTRFGGTCLCAASHVHLVYALQVKFDRQKRLKRIKEMETSLCKELGEQTQPCGKSQIPSEEELKRFLQRVETLERTLVSFHW
jgi:hypothetical protein